MTEPKKEWPILMSADMVNAILAGRKTVTRRESRQWLKRKAGDQLWVRETWRIGTHNDCACYDPCPVCIVGQTLYAANFKGEECQWGPWKPSIHMPRWASRITIRCTEDARLVRLGGMDEAEAKLEGFNNAEEFFAYYKKLHKLPCDMKSEVVRIAFEVVEVTDND